MLVRESAVTRNPRFAGEGQTGKKEREREREREREKTIFSVYEKIDKT